MWRRPCRRLALRMAGEGRRTYAHGVWFVDFTLVAGPGLPIAETQDADVLASVVLAALGMPEQGHASLEQLTGYLRERQVLLVLDNCEHVVAGCARLVDALLISCPGVRVLATSREPLGVTGEVPRRLRVGGPVPGAGARGPTRLRPDRRQRRRRRRGDPERLGRTGTSPR